MSRIWILNFRFHSLDVQSNWASFGTSKLEELPSVSITLQPASSEALRSVNGQKFVWIWHILSTLLAALNVLHRAIEEFFNRKNHRKSLEILAKKASLFRPNISLSKRVCWEKDFFKKLSFQKVKCHFESGLRYGQHIKIRRHFSCGFERGSGRLFFSKDFWVRNVPIKTLNFKSFLMRNLLQILRRIFSHFLK